ncbi:MAG TPA: BON domain-containing protein [Zeimonas sp.]
MRGTRTNDPRTWHGRDWPERWESHERAQTEPNRSAHEFERDRGAFEERSFGTERGREFDAGMHDPRTGEPVSRHADDRGGRGAYEDRNVDARYSGEGYHYPGGARYADESGRRSARVHAHFDENRSWDPADRDVLWRRGEYGSRLYGNVVGAATPSGTAGIRRYAPGRAERRGPKGYARSDERLRDDICERLSDETWLDLSEVEVHVEDGRVRLEGEVRDRYSKHAIEDIADGAWGVKDVDNRIRVRAT